MSIRIGSREKELSHNLQDLLVKNALEPPIPPDDKHNQTEEELFKRINVMYKFSDIQFSKEQLKDSLERLKQDKEICWDGYVFWVNKTLPTCIRSLRLEY